MTTSDPCPPTSAFEPTAHAVSGEFTVATATASSASSFLQEPSQRQYNVAYQCPYPMNQTFHHQNPHLYMSLHTASATLSTPAGSHASSPQSTPYNCLALSVTNAYGGGLSAASMLPTPSPSKHTLHHTGSSAWQATPTNQLYEKPQQPQQQQQQVHALSASRTERTIMIGKLVDVSANIIDSIWHPRFLMDQQRHAKVVSTKRFIQEMLKRSKTTYSTLQISLFYLFRVKRAVHERLRGRMMACQRQPLPNAARSALPPPVAAQTKDVKDLGHAQETSQPKQQELVSERLDDLMCCGRRMFLASLMVASKYLHDKNYRNRAWATMSGLDIAEVNAAEKAFLQLIDYKLFVSKSTFEKWHVMLHELTQKPDPFSDDHGMKKQA